MPLGCLAPGAAAGAGIASLLPGAGTAASPASAAGAVAGSGAAVASGTGDVDARDRRIAAVAAILRATAQLLEE